MLALRTLGLWISLLGFSGSVFSIEPAGTDVRLFDHGPDFALRSTAGTPRGDSSIRLWDIPDLNQSLEVGATALPRESLPQYAGRISFLNSSFFGIELRMSFPTGDIRSSRRMEAGRAAEQAAGQNGQQGS